MVTWTRIARNDLKAVHDYIALDSAFYAKKTIREIVEKTLMLSDFPERGHIVPELADTRIREIFAYSYRIIYQISPDRIDVLTVVHGHKNLQADDIPVQS